MVAMHPKKKVEIVIDASATSDVVRILEEAGARGHSVLPGVTGKGHRGIRPSHDIFGMSQSVLIMTITTEAVANDIVERVMALLQRHAGIVYTTDVAVARSELF